MYYTENNFALLVRSYNGAVFTHFGRQHRANTPIGKTLAVIMTGPANWGNLLRWLKEVSVGSVVIPEFDELQDCGCGDCGAEERALAGMFDIATALRWRLRPNEVETVLEGAHQVLTEFDHCWA
jgi:hypothetical protein